MSVLPEEIARIVIAHLDAGPVEGVFRWADDGLAGYAWAYAVHVEAVGAWNAAGRPEPFADALRAWVQDGEKVSAALSLWRLR